MLRLVKETPVLWNDEIYCTRPEIEPRIPFGDLELNRGRDKNLSLTTCVDLLEVYRHPKPSARWTKDLDHDSLLERVDKNDRVGRSSATIPALRVFFFSLNNNGVVQAHLSTLEWLRNRVGVSAIFLDAVMNARYGASGKTGQGCFCKRNKHGNVVAIDAFYTFSHGYGAQAFGLNFTESVKNEIVHCALGQNPESLTRLCAIDAFIINDYCSVWARSIDMARDKLISYERVAASRLPSLTEMAYAVETLHGMSQMWHIIYEDLTDTEEILELLADICKRYDSDSSESQDETTRSLAEENPVIESLTFLISRNRIWKRWTMNYNERTKIRINLFFNLAAQSDSRTNLQIANLTSRISVETARDSSSMITIAAVTMFFLPGTFVCGIFSTIFWDKGTDANGRTTITLTSRWWYYVVVTIPLTILVFLVWVLWQRRREAKSGFVNHDSPPPTTSREKVEPSGG